MAITLRPGEEVKFEVGFHWSVFLLAKLAALVGVLIILGGVFQYLSGPRTGQELGFTTFVGLLFFLPFCYRWLQNKNKVYLVTTQRVYLEEGILSKTQREIPVEKINDLSMHQSIFQRMVGSGNVIILTGNDRGIGIKDIENPEQFKTAISLVSQKRPPAHF